MKKLLLLTFLFTSFLCDAQQQIPVIEWSKCYGGSGTDEGYSIVKGNQNNYIIAGNTNSSNGDVSGRRGLADAWIIKIDLLGNLLTKNCFGSIQDDDAKSITNGSDGGFVFAGYTNAASPSGDITLPANNAGWGNMWISKMDSSNNLLWNQYYGGGNNIGSANSIIKTLDNGYIAVGKVQTLQPTNDFNILVVKVSQTGNIQWVKTFAGTNLDFGYGVIQNTDSSYILLSQSYSVDGDMINNTYGTCFIIKINKNGDKIWGKPFDAFIDPDCYILGTPNNGFIFTSTNTITSCDSIGNILWHKTITDNDSTTANILLNKIIVSNDGGYLVNGSKQIFASQFGTYHRFFAFKLNTNGEIVWKITFGGNGDDLCRSIIETSDGCLLVGSTSSNSGGITGNHGDYDILVVKVKILDKVNTIKGNTFQSTNNNCLREANEKIRQGILVQTQNNGYFGISDTSGKYTILTDTGTYNVRSIFPKILKPFLDGGLVCPPSGYHTVSFSQYGQDTSEINFANYEKQCAYLQVELAQSRMRRCFENTTAIKYCNIGNVDTNNVQIIVQLPEYVTFVSASNPNYTISGKNITFNIGNLRVNECGTIDLVTNVDCVEGITGLTQCIRAYITPRNKCVEQLQPNYALWDKSEVAVEGNCIGSAVRFVIKNIGQNNMSDSSSYRIYKDAVLALTKKFKLPAGDSLVINVTATGNTYRLEADQVPHFPTASTPNATIENCGSGSNARYFVNQMPQDMAAPNMEKICLEIRDSYDPNDKAVSPSGVGAGKLVKHKVPLSFLIRFQNTGTDTAYKVVIVDTLDQNLDLATLEFGAASHPYKIEFTGSGKPILKFTFDKINLVDSFTNEPKSHGFISFKITPYDSIPNGTLVKNNADIYFDFNLPIKTNTTQVSIDDRLPTGAILDLVTAIKENYANYESVFVYPNPFSNTTNFEFLYNTKATQLILFDVNGQMIRQENIAGKTTYQLHKNSLPNGMYFYSIKNNEEEIIARGKLIIQ